MFDKYFYSKHQDFFFFIADNMKLFVQEVSLNFQTHFSTTPLRTRGQRSTTQTVQLGGFFTSLNQDLMI